MKRAISLSQSDLLTIVSLAFVANQNGERGADRNDDNGCACEDARQEKEHGGTPLAIENDEEGDGCDYRDEDQDDRREQAVVVALAAHAAGPGRCAKSAGLTT